MSECSITFLPMVKLRKYFVFPDPFGGAGLDGLDQIGQTDALMDRCKNVKMILDTIQSVQMAIVIFKNAPDVSEQLFPAGLVQGALAIFSGKNDVINDLGVGGQNILRFYTTPMGSKTFHSLTVG